MGQALAWTVLGGMLGCLVAGLGDRRTRTSPTVYRLLASRPYKVWRWGWTVYIVLQSFVGAVLAALLVLVASDELQNPAVAIAAGLVWSPMAARAWFTTVKLARGELPVGPYLAYRTGSRRLQDWLAANHTKVWDRWVDQRVIERLSSSKAAPPPLREYIVALDGWAREAGRKRSADENDAVLAKIARYSAPRATTSTSAGIEAVLRLVRDLRVRGAAAEADRLLYHWGEDPETEQQRRRTGQHTFIAAAGQVGAIVIALVGLVTAVLLAAPNGTSNKPDAEITVESAKALVVGERQLAFTLAIDHADDDRAAACQIDWTATPLEGPDSDTGDEGSVGLQDHQVRGPATLKGAVTVDDDVSLGNLVLVTATSHCTFAGGGGAKSVEREFVWDVPAGTIRPR